MKFSAVFALVSAAVVLASPAAVSLNRSPKEVRASDNTVSLLSCVECPCEGFDGSCRCIPNGCCCT
ncbi:hypothetical protein HBI83_115090 [Parastagonospora nodorum]|nr:hypothetical protein HBI83_115090 [Parastagonospora nodorum]